MNRLNIGLLFGLLLIAVTGVEAGKMPLGKKQAVIRELLKDMKKLEGASVKGKPIPWLNKFGAFANKNESVFKVMLGVLIDKLWDAGEAKLKNLDTARLILEFKEKVGCPAYVCKYLPKDMLKGLKAMKASGVVETARDAAVEFLDPLIDELMADDNILMACVDAVESKLVSEADRAAEGYDAFGCADKE